MKRAYTFIIIGSLFTAWHFKIHNIDLLNTAVGYLLILLGITYVDKSRPIPEFLQARFLATTMVLFELVTPLLPKHDFLDFILSVFEIAIPVLLYFCLIKADYIWCPSSRTRKYLYRFSVIGLSYITLFLLTYVAPQLAILLILITTLYYTFLFYVLIQLRQLATLKGEKI